MKYEISSVYVSLLFTTIKYSTAALPDSEDAAEDAIILTWKVNNLLMVVTKRLLVWRYVFAGIMVTNRAGSLSLNQA